MRIALVRMEGGAAGLPGELAELARACARAGHRVDVFVRRSDLWAANAEPLAANADLVRVAAGPPRQVADAAVLSFAHDFGTRLVDCAGARGPYDIAHASTFLSGAGGTRLRKRFSVPLVLSARAALRGEAAGPQAWPAADESRFEAALARTADRLIACCRLERDALVARHQIDPGRVEVVPLGVDADRFRPQGPAARRAMGVGSDEFVILAVGAGSAGSVDDAVRALGALRWTHRRRARLVIVHPGIDRRELGFLNERDRLQRLAAREGVAGQVVCAAASGECPPELYCGADAFLAAPREDFAGRRALEAMACGVPVIAERAGAVPDLVAEAVNGFLVDPRDWGAIAERLARLAANRELGRAYGRAGIRRVRAGLTWDHAAARLVGVYAATISPHGPGLARIVSGR